MTLQTSSKMWVMKLLVEWLMLETGLQTQARTLETGSQTQAKTLETGSLMLELIP